MLYSDMYELLSPHCALNLLAHSPRKPSSNAAAAVRAWPASPRSLVSLFMALTAVIHEATPLRGRGTPDRQGSRAGSRKSSDNSHHRRGKDKESDHSAGSKEGANGAWVLAVRNILMALNQ